MAKQPKPAPATAASRASVLKPILVRLALFGGTMAAYYGITATAWFREDFFPYYLRLNAQASAWLLNLFGEEAGVNGVTVHTAKYQLSIRKGCDAIEPCALLIAALLVSPATWKEKWPAFALGLPLLLVLNLVRIVSLYYTGVHSPELFETMHVDVWQPGFVALTMIVWAVWAAIVMSRRKPPASAAASGPA